MSLFLKVFWKLFLFLASVKVLWVSIKLLWWWWWMVMRKIIKLSWSYTNDDDDEAGILVSDTGNTGLMYCTPAGSASYLDLYISRIYIYIFFGGEGEKKHTSRTFRCASISSTYISEPSQGVEMTLWWLTWRWTWWPTSNSSLLPTVLST